MSSKTTTTIRPGQLYARRRTGVVREVAGFSTKPNASTPSDGIRRVRLVDEQGNETRVQADQLNKTYRPVQPLNYIW